MSVTYNTSVKCFCLWVENEIRHLILGNPAKTNRHGSSRWCHCCTTKNYRNSLKLRIWAQKQQRRAARKFPKISPKPLQWVSLTCEGAKNHAWCRMCEFFVENHALKYYLASSLNTVLSCILFPEHPEDFAICWQETRILNLKLALTLGNQLCVTHWSFWLCVPCVSAVIKQHLKNTS